MLTAPVTKLRMLALRKSHRDQLAVFTDWQGADQRPRERDLLYFGAHETAEHLDVHVLRRRRLSRELF